MRPGRDRRHRRLAARIPAAFETPRACGRGQIKVINRTGFFLRTDALPRQGDPVSVTFLDRLERKIEVFGIVRSTIQGLDPGRGIEPGFGVGVDTPGPLFIEFCEQLPHHSWS